MRDNWIIHKVCSHDGLKYVCVCVRRECQKLAAHNDRKSSPFAVDEGSEDKREIEATPRSDSEAENEIQ